MSQDDAKKPKPTLQNESTCSLINFPDRWQYPLPEERLGLWDQSLPGQEPLSVAWRWLGIYEKVPSILEAAALARLRISRR